MILQNDKFCIDGKQRKFFRRVREFCIDGKQRKFFRRVREFCIDRTQRKTVFARIELNLQNCIASSGMEAKELRTENI